MVMLWCLTPSRACLDARFPTVSCERITGRRIPHPFLKCHHNHSPRLLFSPSPVVHQNDRELQRANILRQQQQHRAIGAAPRIAVADSVARITWPASGECVQVQLNPDPVKRQGDLQYGVATVVLGMVAMGGGGGGGEEGYRLWNASGEVTLLSCQRESCGKEFRSGGD